MLRTSVGIALLWIMPASLSAGGVAANDLAQAATALQASKWGLFIHYSLATYTTEWQYSSASAPPSLFNPTNLDTDQWARTAKEAGMGSLLFVAKHHDGFCLWDTKTTDRKVTKSPLGKDVLAEVRKSCDKYGLRLGLWFYNPANENSTMPAQDVFSLYRNCEQDGNLLLLGLGPDRSGQLRAIDVATLKQVGSMIRASNAAKGENHQ